MTRKKGQAWIDGVVRDTVGYLRIEVSVPQERQLTAYLRLLVKWNEKINLVSRKSIQTVAADRLFDALLLWREFRPWSGKRHLDIGSGGGFPAVPIHIMAPDTELWLTEPRARRVAFLVSVMAELDLRSAGVKRCRVGEDDSGWAEAALFDIVTAQAVGPAEKVLELAAGQLAVHGRYVWVGAEGIDDARRELVNGMKERFAVTVHRHERPGGRVCGVGDMERIK